MRFAGFSVGQISLDNNNIAGNWLWGQIEQVTSDGFILKSLGALSPVKEVKLKESSENASDKHKIDGGIKKGDIVGWHRTRDSSLGEYKAVIKISIEGTQASCVDFDEKLGFLSVGCNNGSIYVYQISQQNIGEQMLYFEVPLAHPKSKV